MAMGNGSFLITTFPSQLSASCLTLAQDWTILFSQFFFFLFGFLEEVRHVIDSNCVKYRWKNKINDKIAMQRDGKHIYTTTNKRTQTIKYTKCEQSNWKNENRLRTRRERERERKITAHIIRLFIKTNMYAKNINSTRYLHTYTQHNTHRHTHKHERSHFRI